MLAQSVEPGSLLYWEERSGPFAADREDIAFYVLAEDKEGWYRFKELYTSTSYRWMEEEWEVESSAILSLLIALGFRVCSELDIEDPDDA